MILMNFEPYAMHNILSIFYDLHIFAHLAASSNKINGNDQNTILGK